MDSPYPVYPSTPVTGNLPSMEEMGPPDMLPSAHNTYYDVYASTHGRRLAGIGETQMRSAEPGERYRTLDEEMLRYSPEQKDYPDELNQLALLDDVNGNGIFDPAGTHGNVHPDAGIFADSWDLPGYLARERFFRPSEVIDVNTGKPVVYVPGGAVSTGPYTDSSLALLELYEPGMPDTGGGRVQAVSTVEPDEGAFRVPLGQDDAREPASRSNMFLMAAVAGLAAGAVIGLIAPSPRRRRS